MVKFMTALSLCLVLLIAQPLFSSSGLLPDKNTGYLQNQNRTYNSVAATKAPLPSETRTYNYFPPASPLSDTAPKFAKPIGLGPVADGRETLDVHIHLKEFSGGVDLYAAYAASFDPTHVYVLNPDGSTFSTFTVADILAALAAGAPPTWAKAWKSGVTGEVNEGVLKEMDTTTFQSGTYRAYLLVTPTGDFTRYYLWSTYFDVVVPGTFNIHGDGTGYGLTDSSGEAIMNGEMIGLQYDRQFVVTDSETNPISGARIFTAEAERTDIAYISDPDRTFEPVFIMGDSGNAGGVTGSSVPQEGSNAVDGVQTTIQTRVTLNAAGSTEIYPGFHDTMDFSIHDIVGDRIISYMKGLHPQSGKNGVYCMTVEEIVQFFRDETAMVSGLLTIAPLVPDNGSATIADSAIRIRRTATTSARSDITAFSLKSYEAGKLTTVPQWLSDLNVNDDRIPFVVLSHGLIPHGVVLISAPYVRVLLSPGLNESYAGITPLEIRSCDIQGVQELQLYVDQTMQGSLVPADPYAGEYVIDWDTTMVPDDGHTIFAESSNPTEWGRMSNEVFVIVDNLFPPYYQASLLDVEQNTFYSQLFAKVRKLVHRIVN